MNVTNTERLLKTQKESYKDAARQNSNLTTGPKEMINGTCQPKFCSSSCLPAIKKEVCRDQRKIYVADEQCYLQNITTLSYHHVQKNRTLPKLKYKKTFICWSECFKSSEKRKQQRVANSGMPMAPSVFEKLEYLGRLGVRSSAAMKKIIQGFEFGAIEGSVASLFGSCYRYCGYDYIPFTTMLTHQEYKMEPVAKLLTRAKCENNFRSANRSLEKVYGCLNTTQCKSIHLNVGCLKTQHECHQIRKSIKSRLANKSSTETAFQAIAKSSFIHGLLMTKRNLLLQQVQNVEQQLELAEVVNRSASKRYAITQKSLKWFEDIVKQDRSLIEKFKKKPELFRSNGLKFNFKYLSGMEFPKQFLIEINVFNLASTVFFDVSNYPKSVREISLEIKDLLKETVLKRRRKRSFEGLQPNKMEKKCLSMQQAETFIVQVLETYKYRLSTFSKMKSLIAGQIKIKNKQLENLKVNISSQISGAFNDSISKLLNKELNEIFENTLNIENETFSRSTWNLTLKEILLELEILTYDLQPTTCVNLADCLQFYIDLMKDMVQLETKINLSNVTEKIQSWKDNILHLILAYPDIK